MNKKVFSKKSPAIISFIITAILIATMTMPSIIALAQRRIGDLNGDGTVSADDYLLLKKAVLGNHTLSENEQAAADCNGDGKITAADYFMVKRDVLGSYHIEGFVDAASEQPSFSEGLEFDLNVTKETYRVIDIGTCEDTRIIIPSEYNGLPVTGIADAAFSGYTSITAVSIPESVVFIGAAAFKDCTALEEITLPDSIRSISANAFDNTACYNDESNWENDVLYIGKCLIKAKTSISGQYITKNDTLVIADSAFATCRRLTGIEITDSVRDIGTQAFYYGSALSDITIGSGVESIASQAFEYTKYYNDKSNWEDGVLYIGKYLLNADTTLSGQYTTKEGTRVIADRAFSNCSLLKRITLSDGLINIGYRSFYNCTVLANITIPSSVKSINPNAFACDQTINVYITDIAAWCEIDFCGYYLDRDNSGDEPLTTSISFNGANLYLNGELISDLVIPEGVTSISKYAFSGCTALNSVIIPDSVTIIGNYAFSCSHIKEVTIGNGVTKIGKRAFYYTPLESAVFLNPSGWWATSDLGLPTMYERNFSDPTASASILCGYDSQFYFLRFE